MAYNLTRIAGELRRGLRRPGASSGHRTHRTYKTTHRPRTGPGWGHRTSGRQSGGIGSIISQVRRAISRPH